MTVLRAAFLAALVQAGAALGQSSDDPAPAQLTGTLAKVRAERTLTIAYRESSVPFSYLSSRGEPIGYSIELCKALVDAIGDAVHKTLAIRWVAVNPATRIEAVSSGRVDLECGSTTSNLERQKLVSFSPILFVAGTKLLVKKGSPVKSFRDLAGQTVAVTGGTTNEKTMRDLSARFKLNLNLLVSPDHAESFAQVKSGRAVAFALDDVLLYGFIAQDKSDNGGRTDYDVVGEFLSYDPYGVMFRKGDASLAQVVHDTFVTTPVSMIFFFASYSVSKP